jgi:para-aminobenzoate synthetase/4-amino-4-deoxychorismate lyase
MNRWLSLPAEVYALVEQTPATVLLEGGRPNYSEGKRKPWTRLFITPVRVLAVWQAAEIPWLFAEIETAVAAGMSAAGFFAYECGNCFEPKAGMRASREGQRDSRVAAPRSRSLEVAATIRESATRLDHQEGTPTLESPQPLAWFGIYARSYVFDHTTGGFVDGEPAELDRFRSASANAEGGAIEPELEMASRFALDEAEYARRIAAIHEWIRAGDVYQLNFTAPLRIETHHNAAALYARLRARQPVDYGAFLHWEQGRFIQSFSPELFFRIENRNAEDRTGRRIETRPMKGTAPRGRTTREDLEMAEWLRNDPKNRSENVMIVDLLRNDLGRVARTGSVRATRLFEVERLSTLWQMTSTVSAELRPKVGFHEIFRALFPSGSVTGAPKVRSMQLLAGLEDTPRGVYTGAIGFFSPRETVFNVAIRTLELEGEHGGDIRGTMGVGSGIVIDSDAAAEYRECLLKAAFLTRSSYRQPQRFSIIETMLWHSAHPLGDFPFLQLHLDRLADSADYFGFACDLAAIRTALEVHAKQFAYGPPRSPRRVRLLLDALGKFEITDEVLPEGGEAKRIARVCIAPERTDPTDAMLYHKTTHRPLYTPAFEQAAREGFDEVLFLNLREEVTEGAISNVFVEKDGRWSTPPVECGLLPGVFRRHLLGARPEIRERVLTLDDLRRADAVYLANAVRGLRRAMIAW